MQGEQRIFKQVINIKIMVKLTKKVNLSELLEKYPQSAEVLFNHGMHCLGCMATQMETLEDGCKAHGMPAKEIEKIVAEINKLTKK